MSNISNSEIVKNFNFNFIETCLTGFIKDFSKKIHILDDKIPIYIFNSGDELFILNWQTSKITKEDKFKNSSDLYPILPRIEMSIGSVSFNSDQLSNPYIEGKFIETIGNKDYALFSNVRRIPFNIPIQMILYCDNFLLSLKYTEVLMTLLYRLNTYDFFHHKRRFNASYDISDSLDKNDFSLSHEQEKRNRTISIDVTLEAAFPSFDLFKLTEDGVRVGNEGVMNEIEHNVNDGNTGENLGNQIIDENTDNGDGDNQVGDVDNPYSQTGPNKLNKGGENYEILDGPTHIPM